MGFSWGDAQRLLQALRERSHRMRRRAEQQPNDSDDEGEDPSLLDVIAMNAAAEREMAEEKEDPIEGLKDMIDDTKQETVWEDVQKDVHEAMRAFGPRLGKGEEAPPAAGTSQPPAAAGPSQPAGPRRRRRLSECIEALRQRVEAEGEPAEAAPAAAPSSPAPAGRDSGRALSPLVEREAPSDSLGDFADGTCSVDGFPQEVAPVKEEEADGGPRRLLLPTDAAAAEEVEAAAAAAEPPAPAAAAEPRAAPQRTSSGRPRPRRIELTAEEEDDEAAASQRREEAERAAASQETHASGVATPPDELHEDEDEPGPASPAEPVREEDGGDWVADMEQEIEAGYPQDVFEPRPPAPVSAPASASSAPPREAPVPAAPLKQEPVSPAPGPGPARRAGAPRFPAPRPGSRGARPAAAPAAPAEVICLDSDSEEEAAPAPPAAAAPVPPAAAAPAAPARRRPAAEERRPSPPVAQAGPSGAASDEEDTPKRPASKPAPPPPARPSSSASSGSDGSEGRPRRKRPSPPPPASAQDAIASRTRSRVSPPNAGLPSDYEEDGDAPAAKRSRLSEKARGKLPAKRRGSEETDEDDDVIALDSTSSEEVEYNPTEEDEEDEEEDGDLVDEEEVSPRSRTRRRLTPLPPADVAPWDGKEVPWERREIAPGVGVHSAIAAHLMDHQRDGVRFLWKSCVTQADEMLQKFEEDTREKLRRGGKPDPRRKEPVCGGILAHCMGLGKTLTTIAFLHTRYEAERAAGRTPCFLLVVPVNTIHNWLAELHRWVPPGAPRLPVYPSLDETRIDKAADLLEQWRERGGVQLIGYERFRNLVLTKEHRAKITKAQNKQRRAAVHSRDEEALEKLKNAARPKINYRMAAVRREIARDPLDGPDQAGARRARGALIGAGGYACPLDLLVLDEGHRIKSDETQVAVAASLVRARRRAILTGYPLQNNLWEYYHMVSYVRPGVLGTLGGFWASFIWPIDLGTFKDSTDWEVKGMYKRLHVLHEQVKPYVDRKDAKVLRRTITEHNKCTKHEFVVQVALDPVSADLYARLVAAAMEGTLLPHVPRKRTKKGAEQAPEPEGGSDAARKAAAAEARRASARAPNVLVTRAVALKIINTPEVLRRFVRKLKEDGVRRPSCPMGGGLVDDLPLDEAGEEGGEEGAGPRRKRTVKVDYGSFVDPSFADRPPFAPRDSNKVAAALAIAKASAAAGDKVLLFSTCLATLDVVERAARDELGYEDDEQLFRIDGSTPGELRQARVDRFNTHPGSRLFVISTVAGGIGINLASANRVIVMDACWNPCHDTQALFRAYRYGQTKDVFVYRLVAAGTIESRVYSQQVVKQSLFKRAIDSETTARHVARHEAKDYFSVPLDWRYPSRYADVLEKDLVLKTVVSEFSVPGPADGSQPAEEEEEDEGDDEGGQAAMLRALGVDSPSKRHKRLKRAASEGAPRGPPPEGVAVVRVHEHESLLADDDPGGKISEQERRAAEAEVLHEREAERLERAAARRRGGRLVVEDSGDEGAEGEAEEGGPPAPQAGGPGAAADGSASAADLAAAMAAAASAVAAAAQRIGLATQPNA